MRSLCDFTSRISALLGLAAAQSRMFESSCGVDVHTNGEVLISPVADHLPADALRRAEQFLRAGDLSALMNLPLRPDERIEAAEVLSHASSTQLPSPPGDPLPTLSKALYDRLHAIATTGEGAHVGAALFILATDFQARACNLAMHEVKGPSIPVGAPRTRSPS